MCGLLFEGKVIGLDDMFGVVDSLMRFPRDEEYSLNPSNVIGCRCSVEYLKGDAKTVDKGNDFVRIKKGELLFVMDLQLFSENGIKNQKSISIKRGIRTIEARIIEHKEKLADPSKFVPEWNGYDKEHQEGLKGH